MKKILVVTDTGLQKLKSFPGHAGRPGMRGGSLPGGASAGSGDIASRSASVHYNSYAEASKAALAEFSAKHDGFTKSGERHLVATRNGRSAVISATIQRDGTDRAMRDVIRYKLEWGDTKSQMHDGWVTFPTMHMAKMGANTWLDTGDQEKLTSVPWDWANGKG